MLKADDLLAGNANSNGNTEDWLKDIGSRRTPNVNLKPDPDGFDVESYRPSHSVQVKEEPLEDPMDVDDLPGKRKIHFPACLWILLLSKTKQLTM